MASEFRVSFVKAPSPPQEDKIRHRTLDFTYIGMIQFGSGVKILSKNI